MKEQNTTTAALNAASTKTTSTEATSAKPVTYHDNGEAVTIRVSGAAYANLRRIADTMNDVRWCGNDNTPASVLREWTGTFIERIAETPKTCSWENVSELISDILFSIDTGHADGTPEDKARRDELEAAFKAADLYA